MTAAGRKERRAALHDPLRSSGGLHEAGRLRRGVAEFLRLPLLIILAFSAAGVLTSVLDASADDEAPLREWASRMVPGEGSVEFVSAVATSVVTVTSITFSVLLLAVQQTAGSLTAVVFDQFLRRTANQVYFGFFIGLSAFSFLVLGLARQDPPPVYGAAVAFVLTIVALVVLLLLIHGSIDQMRPQSVIRSIHELALRARERELSMLGRVRARRRSPEGVPERAVTVYDSGYVVSVDMDGLAGTARAAGRVAGDGSAGEAGAVEVIVEGRLGEYAVFGDVVARLAGVAPDDGSWDDAVRSAFGLDDIRDVEVECGYATDQLENIAWAASSSAQQSPQTAVTAVRALRDLLARWLIAGERDRSDRADRPEELPVVYVDGVVPRVLESLATAMIASAESRQAQTCAELLRAFAGVAPRLRRDDERAAFDATLDGVLPSVIQHAELPELTEALRDLERVMDECGHDASRVARVRALLWESTDRLLPKPSDEPEAAHPE
ncbi:membrane protein [Planomonospora sphaerica]|uniref:Membrane protein n=1 Tax=Planomonospora sphaerica TaxID=161355 RepID=A0A161LBB3_9ACTN|nr:DUF2254 family protein [Planomonospora sphaerica]GAT65344.1 membrane protein [Planomonospora sphaerica]